MVEGRCDLKNVSNVSVVGEALGVPRLRVEVTGVELESPVAHEWLMVVEGDGEEESAEVQARIIGRWEEASSELKRAEGHFNDVTDEVANLDPQADELVSRLSALKGLLPI